ncbi:hypothetical protein DESC_460122 [Desulfosarcina cetonica]|nr:hypothetical protein DESC_460122 [Desulfosarcina cetonica]
MHDVADHQNRHRGVDDIQGVGQKDAADAPTRRVEEEDIRQTDDQAGQGQGQDGEKIGRLAQDLHLTGLLDEIGAAEGDRRAENGRIETHAHTVEEGGIAASAGAREVIMPESQGEGVGPYLDQGGVHGGEIKTEDENRAQAAESQVEPVAQCLRPGNQGDRFGGDLGDLPVLDDAVDDKGHHRGNQQHHADHGAHGKVLLADHLFVDVRGQDVGVAADHLGGTEVGKGQDEADHHRAGQAVAHAGQGHGEEAAHPAGAQGLGGFVKARVGHGQGDGENQHGLGKGEQDLGDDDAHRSVHVDVHAGQGAEESPGDQSLAAEEIDQRDAVEQGRREQRHHGDGLEESLGRHAGAGEGVSPGEAEADGEQGGDRRNKEAVEQGLGEGRCLEVSDEVGKPHETAAVVDNAFDQQLEQGQNHHHHQPDADQDDQKTFDPLLSVQVGRHGKGARF